ncbi:uncharacterized protein LOC111599498 [Drosophila hydei]|uniref:Uncharacterized protein LOC111599498 n=1 Tax=Drosophila hydei TaxID=7224 RepID=A0A6J1LWS0_DROHY|nr:uncharacterized protein LOC111599498 [Drosophila hydei]
MIIPRSCLCRLIYVLLLLQHSWAIRIENTSSSVAPAGYRVSRPEPKQPAQRVPQHLQDIRPGYVDDDAGDVIRIIEPPPHFQQLKRLRQRQPLQAPAAGVAPPKPIVWEQPRKLSTNRGAPPQHRVKSPEGDLLTQETQLSSQLANNLQLPMEILASVRKTERLLQRQRQHQPQLRQRHIQRQTHTLIAQKSLEQQLFQRGQQQRLRAALLQEHKRSKRVKRQTETSSNSSYDVPHGLKLVAHIGELLKNASRFVPDEGEPHELEAKSKSTLCGNATNCDSRRRRQRLFRLSAQKDKKTAAGGRNFRHEATTTTTKATTTTTTTAEAKVTSNLTTSATPLASRLVNSRKSPNNRNQKQLEVARPLQRSSDSVLYADVMSTIRNLWQEHDLAAGPQFVPAEQVHNNSDYRALDVYLKELDDISKKLPTVAPITALNQEEFVPVTPTPNWYLINNEGLIYETRLNSETKPTAALFHRFPDMPKAQESLTTLDLE